MKLAQDIILKPIITEKAMDGIASKKYTFKVAPGATKPEIAKAVEELFGVEAGIFDAGAVEADMAASRVRYQRALYDEDCRCPAITAEALTAYPGLGQSVAQVVHNTDERCKKLG